MPSPRPFFRPVDAVLVLLVSAASAWGFLAFRFSPAGKAVVYVGSVRYGWYDLGGALRRVQVPTRIGFVELEVGNGSARVIHSPCPNQLCVKQGSVRRAHAELICMPAHLLVSLEGGEGNSEPQPDAVTY
jgi:hypothetical protein